MCKNKGITTSTTTKKISQQITLIKFNYLGLLKLTSAWLNMYLTPEKGKSILFYLKKQIPPMYFFVDCVKTVIILSSQIDNGLHQKEKVRTCTNFGKTLSF